MDNRRAKIKEIYEEQFDYVWNSLRRLNIPERELEDVAHEVFMTAYENLHKYDEERPIQPWLFGIAFRIASNYREKASNHREFLNEPDPPSQAPEIPGKLSEERAREVVRRALDEVEMERRAVFVLNKLDGHPIPEIAESLGIPVNTAYSRLRLAKEAFTQAARSIMAEEEKV